ncbi:Cof-type HAD-IIB family hydrolase [Paenibacillus eucommiae]|uniref:Cof subfamily protein (Haloacid dehalogenase superfamily) n=1 Tax=Paenibacillus eucommiae TaxID=1355755 RepID=A0ABS4J8C2_9BACL|nr:Cof-type HAD-IIB family hydrolase [Paenibacillus eucommiae]MBP1996094.1 Cof subfamily protein (haloacid dehalogenase superfamily) [Paenibacillus eucommiae]
MPYKIVFFDIDGTLINGHKQIPQDTIEAIKQLKASNIHVVIATGRSPYHLKPIAEEVGIDSYISFNGSIVVHQGELIHRQPISVHSLQALDQMAKSNSHPLVYLGDEGYYANHDQHPHILETFHELNIQPPAYNPDYWKDNSIFQVMMYCQHNEELSYVQVDEEGTAQSVPDVKAVRWHALSVDIIPAVGSKARGIEALLNHMGISPAEAVAFGDALNDREMLSYVGMGIAMGNALDELKALANFTTRHVNDGGIRYGLQHIGLI